MQLAWGARPPRAQRAAPSRPHRACGRPNHSVRAESLGFGARAHRTTAEAAVLPRLLYCIVTAEEMDCRERADCHNGVSIPMKTDRTFLDQTLRRRLFLTKALGAAGAS